MDSESAEVIEEKPLKVRLGLVLDRVEKVYLKILRAVILIIATGLIAYAAILALISLYKIVQSPSSVHEEVAVVAANELTSAEATLAVAPNRSSEARVDPAQRRAYDQFVRDYYQLFHRRFEAFRQSEDHPLDRAEFGQRFVNVQARLVAIGRGELDFTSDIADLRTLLGVMTEAATLPATQERLRRYKAARKVQTCRDVERTRPTVTVEWNTYSMACSTWYENGGCAVSRTIQTPYTARECSMQFPQGTQSHLQIFRAYQDRYFQLLTQRRTENGATAETSRGAIVAGNIQGRMNLWTALTILGGFLVLMFFFLLIAIERHQRRLVAEAAVK